MRRRAPVIGITCEVIRRTDDYSDYDLLCDHRYPEAVKRAGGHPVLLPVARRPWVRSGYFKSIDGLVIVGGDDVDPRLYGEEAGPHTRVNYHERTAFESWLYRASLKRSLPVLAICHGMQLVNVLEGGSLIQHLEPSTVQHGAQPLGVHRVRLLPGRLRRLLRARDAEVATEHHQAVKRLAPGFTAAAVADDGVIEAIESPRRPQLLAVQWHPERRLESAATRRLFKGFVRLCAGRAR